MSSSDAGDYSGPYDFVKQLIQISSLMSFQAIASNSSAKESFFDQVLVYHQLYQFDRLQEFFFFTDTL